MKITNTLRTLFAAEFLRDLLKNIKKFDAYKLGLIDEKFNILRKPKNKKEKNALSLYYKLIFKIRKSIGIKSLLSLIGLLLILEKENDENSEKYLEILKEILNDIGKTDFYFLEDK